MKKYIFLTFIALSISSLSVGCVGQRKFFSQFGKKSSEAQEEYMALVDRKILELEQALSDLNLSTLNLVKLVEELAQKTTDIDTNYSKLNTTLDKLSSQVETKDSSMVSTISETQKNINDLTQKLSEIEQVKTDLQNQALALQSQRFLIRNSEIEQQSDAMKEEAKEMIEELREMVKEAKGEIKPEAEKKAEETATEQGKEAVQRLLDEALALYRDENYKDAIGKWEAVLVIDPANLEAKFNIEIAKEKIKPSPGK